MIARPHLSRASHPALDFIGHQQDAVPVADAPQLAQKFRRRDHVPSFALDRLDKDGGNLVARHVGAKQLFLDDSRAVHATVFRLQVIDAAIAIGVGNVDHPRDERTEAAALRRAAGGQRESTVGAPMKGVGEGNELVPARINPRQFHGGFNRFRSRVAEIDAFPPRAGRNLGEFPGQGHQAGVVEIRPRHMDQFRGLRSDGADDLRVAVPGGDHGDPGAEVQEPIAVHVLDQRAPASLGDERIAAGIGRRDIEVILFDDPLCQGTGKAGAEQRPLGVGGSGGFPFGWRTHYFRLQRTPSRVSSMRTPASTSASRIWSASAKFLPRRASCRS